jgi:UvrD-like helicase C-terminal domain/AAA domain/Nuclease-related domain
MAQMIPATVPPQATSGEKTLFKVLAALPEDVYVYYDVQIRHRFADLVVISPRLGVLMIEIKDWKPSSIISANHDTVELRLHSHNKKVAHPLRQARQYAFALMDEIQSRLEGRVLLEQDGPHRGKILFPISYLACLSQISDHDIQRLNLSSIFDVDRTLTKEWLTNARDIKGSELESLLARYFVPKFQFTPLDNTQIDHLRGIIHPHIVVRSATQKLRDHYADSGRSFANFLQVLDAKQEQKARNIGPGHRLIFGVAGSGKTTILIARAKYLAEQNPDKRGLFLCFNRPLATYLKVQLADFANVTVQTFHQLAFRFGFDDRNWHEEFSNELKAAILRRKERYDFILIDEAQDFDPDWFACVVALSKDPNEADLFITGDGSQGLYRQRNKRFSWKSKGIQAQGRTEYLSENYRNAAKIYQLATRFSGPSTFGEIEGESNSLGDDQSRSVASGGNIFVIQEKDRAGEISKVVNLVSQLLAGKCELDPQINNQFHFADIGIIYPTHKNQETLITELLLPRIKAECNIPAVWVSDPNGANRSNFSPAIRIQTIHHAKGLQYRAVIFLWADLLPFAQGRDVKQDRKLFYVALTRATELLAIVHSGHSSFVAETYTAIEKKRDHWLAALFKSRGPNAIPSR